MTDRSDHRPSPPVPADVVQHLFTRADGSYLCARWGRPIVPVVFGPDDASLSILKSAISAVVNLAGHVMAETDPQMGANLMMFYCQSWQELRDARGIGHLVPDPDLLLHRLEAENAQGYRLFRFEADGRIRAAITFTRLSAARADLPGEALALSEAAQMILLWGEGAFATLPLLALDQGRPALSGPVARVIRAAYDPVLPGVARDPAHAYRIAARTGVFA